MTWSNLCNFRFNRDYMLFALMAGVRRYNYLPDAKLLEEALAKRGSKTLKDPFLSEAETELILHEASDSGITQGQPSFREKGIPRDIGWETVEDYTLTVLDNENDELENCCTRSQATNWIGKGSSEPWEVMDGEIIKITGPDWHTPSWLNTDEVETLAKRLRLALESTIPTAKAAQKKNVQWAKKGLESALKDNDAERIAMMTRELTREQNWETHDPIRNQTLTKVEGLALMMRRIELDENIKARLVFWFDN